VLPEKYDSHFFWCTQDRLKVSKIYRDVEGRKVVGLEIIFGSIPQKVINDIIGLIIVGRPSFDVPLINYRYLNQIETVPQLILR